MLVEETSSFTPGRRQVTVYSLDVGEVSYKLCTYVDVITAPGLVWYSPQSTALIHAKEAVVLFLVFLLFRFFKDFGSIALWQFHGCHWIVQKNALHQLLTRYL